jgi:ATP-dependent DNA ligase
MDLMLCRSLTLAEAMKTEWNTKNEGNSRFWYIEQKIDGSRYQLVKKDGKAYLTGRRGFEHLKQFPEFLGDIAKLPDNTILDGEVFAGDFETTLSRENETKPLMITLKARRFPAKFFVFDVLQYNGQDVRDLNLASRKAWLEKLFYGTPYSCFVKIPRYKSLEEGIEEVKKVNGEGLVLKWGQSNYTDARSPNWIKVKFTKTKVAEIKGFEQKANIVLITEYGRCSVPSQNDQKFYLEHRPKQVVVEFLELTDNNKWRQPKFERFIEGVMV